MDVLQIGGRILVSAQVRQSPSGVLDEGVGGVRYRVVFLMSYFRVKTVFLGLFKSFLGRKRDFRSFLGKNMPFQVFLGLKS